MSDTAIEHRVLKFRIAPWLIAYMAYLDTTGATNSIERMDDFRAGWDAAKADQ